MNLSQENHFLQINCQTWNQEAHRFFGRTPLPDYGPFAPGEEELRLLGDVENKRVLDIGCGSGHSLQYMALRKAGELWGLDLSSTQIETARQLLQDKTPQLRLFASPMEADPGLPHGYFDIVYSIFALGWTVNLHKTFNNIWNYLKPGGVFVFSWEHPLYNRVEYQDDSSIFHKSYLQEGPYYHEKWPAPAVMHQYKLSTYVNELIGTGFQIEKVIEEVSIPDDSSENNRNAWYFIEKAKLVPATLIMKSRKPG
ncbi:class I SAM-dependent methyltransferase [Brevibacillus sp. B_LB10_24]|uniref:class I SAM-dependent methyltransferase n=1 Tax=Brevibacillus sp. B_LB10_24 TaxID=3380645 RepID=UPI0038BCCA0D